MKVTQQNHTDVKIMGIVNVTPDSFYDGGHYHQSHTAISHALQLIKEGADFIDVGGESTRPGATPVSVDEECARVIPVIEKLAQETSIPISVDTRHTVVMQEAIKAGASFINDVAALTDKHALAVVAAKPVKVCLMHMQGNPQGMQLSPQYDDILVQIKDFLSLRIQACEDAGIKKENIYIDPGFGFGKTLAHNLTLLANLTFFNTLGCPLLVGLSRKSMFGALLNRDTHERLPASLSATLIAALQGVSIVRTHDVAATNDVLNVMKAIKPYCKESLRVRTA